MQTTNAASEKIQRGKRCAQIIDEVRRLKNLVVGAGRTMAEVKEENPTLLVWAFRDTLLQQDREIFDHPNQWGPVVGYALGLLSKEYGKSPTTINDWVKAFRHHERQRSTPFNRLGPRRHPSPITTRGPSCRGSRAKISLVKTFPPSGRVSPKIPLNSK